MRAKALAERADDEVHLVRQPRSARRAAAAAIVMISMINHARPIRCTSLVQRGKQEPVYKEVLNIQDSISSKLAIRAVLPGANHQGGVRVIDGEQEAVPAAQAC